MKAICITGSVGTGKTTLAKKLAKALKYKYIDVNQIIKKHKLHDSYDRKNKCFVVDTKKLNKFLIKLIKESKQPLILDSHLSHYIPKTYVSLCIVTTTEIEKLSKRLKKRRYPKQKVFDNLEAEIFKVCLLEAKNHNLLVIDTTKEYNIKNITKYIKNETINYNSR